MEKMLRFVSIILICLLMASYVFSLLASLDCKEDDCGDGCLDGNCAEADWCQDCVIHNCWDPEKGEYYDYVCGT